ncbi:MAG: NAD(P)-dependent alcohol dehydrogenase [Intrasporangiaceae bacterium]|nr:NAD(P)-dependent alcohol dehydrogenase [Intrasporangiaceae bacterium]
MSTTTRALAAPSAGAPFEAVTIERRDLRPNDVRIKIAYAGVCHSDIHQVREEWGRALFPMVPGHEIAGTVTEIGSDVTRHQVGDRVGVGCMVDSCGECEMCEADHENFCQNRTVWTYNDTYPDGEVAMGGYSQEVVVAERFAARIPEGIELDVAAPLLCAGVTVFNPLKRWGAGPGKKVAVIGLGGLGHMAVKIAAAMGAEVTVLSQSMSKAEDGKAFGAVDYRATADGSAFKELRGSFDIIINTVSVDVPLDRYLGMLRPFGAVVNVGLPTSPQQVRISSLTSGDKVLTGSNIGGMAITQEMLDFCAEHGIGATIETISADQVTEAYDRVVGSDVRYRFVIDVSTIPAE